VKGSPNTPAPWTSLVNRVCVQLLKNREFNSCFQTLTDPITKFNADVSRILGDPEAYRLSRPRLHEAIARLYLYKGVNDSVSKLEATAYVVQQLELILPTDAPAGCLHYSRAEVNQFIMHSMSYSDSDDADASLLHLLRMLDYFYLSQTVSDPYSEFLAMHWAKGVTWEAYVLSIIHFAQKHRYFQKLEEHGHQGSAPVNMDADQVFMNHLTNELRRCVREDGDRSDASRLYTLYALDRKKEITNPQTLLDDLALRGNLKNACRSEDFAEDDADF
jgi:hypothetical protein